MMIIPPSLSDGIIIIFLFIDEFLLSSKCLMGSVVSSVFVRVAAMIPYMKPFSNSVWSNLRFSVMIRVSPLYQLQILSRFLEPESQ